MENSNDDTLSLMSLKLGGSFLTLCAEQQCIFVKLEELLSLYEQLK